MMHLKNMLARFFGKHPAPFVPRNEISDQSVESLIEQAGRKEVFSTARALGWGADNPPPKWVWVQICREILYKREQVQAGLYREALAQAKMGTPN